MPVLRHVSDFKGLPTIVWPLKMLDCMYYNIQFYLFYSRLKFLGSDDVFPPETILKGLGCLGIACRCFGPPHYAPKMVL